MTEPTAPKRFQVRVREHHGGGLFELEITTWHEVIDTVRSEIVMRFEGGYAASYDGVGWADGVSGGVSEVTVTPDERWVEVRFAGGHVERHALPGAA